MVGYFITLLTLPADDTFAGSLLLPAEDTFAEELKTQL